MEREIILSSAPFYSHLLLLVSVSLPLFVRPHNSLLWWVMPTKIDLAHSVKIIVRAGLSFPAKLKVDSLKLQTQNFWAEIQSLILQSFWKKFTSSKNVQTVFDTTKSYWLKMVCYDHSHFMIHSSKFQMDLPSHLITSPSKVVSKSNSTISRSDELWRALMVYHYCMHTVIDC